MRLTELIRSLDIYPVNSKLHDFEVKGISCDSRRVRDNFVFVAIKGIHENGHGFIHQAIENGAKAVVIQSQARSVSCQDKINIIKVDDTRKNAAHLVAEFYGRPSTKIKLIGITGTNGKTTVSYLIEAILKEANFNPAVIGTIECRFKDKVLPSKNTTPGPIELHAMLADMVREGVDYAVMEISSHALHQERTAGINFSSAIFTNLSSDHLDYHQTVKDYFQAKAKLFRNIPPGAFVIINNDDRYGRMLKDLTVAEVATYGIQGPGKRTPDVSARDIKFAISHTEFLLCSNKGNKIFKTRLIGRHNIYNILSAVSFALKEGIDLPLIKSAIEKFYFVPGRLERIDCHRDFTVFVDYAHTEDALKNVINTLRQLPHHKIIVVFGCGGQRDKTKRPKMGKVVSELADFAIITNDNPRSEDPKEIIEDIKRGIKKENFSVVFNRREAIRKALSLTKSGDIILIAGKGHEGYQILKDRTIPFDDRKIVRECLGLMS